MVFDLGLQPRRIAIDEGRAIALMLVDDIGEFGAFRSLDREQDQDMARNARFPAPLASAALQMFLMASASGMGRDDDASVARLYGRISGTKLPGGQ